MPAHVSYGSDFIFYFGFFYFGFLSELCPKTGSPCLHSHKLEQYIKKSPQTSLLMSDGHEQICSCRRFAFGVR